MDIAARTVGCLKGVVESEGLELVHVEYEPRGSVLRVYIDKPGGVNLKDCETVSKQASVVLDVEDLIPHHYVLEVSSPGVERPLFKQSDYERFTGEEIRLTTTEKVDNRRRFTGFIRNVSDGVLDLECEEKTYRIPFQKIKGAKLVYRFD